MKENEYYYYIQPNGAEVVLKKDKNYLNVYNPDDLTKSVANRQIIEDTVFNNVYYYGGDMQEAEESEYVQITFDELKEITNIEE